jgi:hypothetical protein
MEITGPDGRGSWGLVSKDAKSTKWPEIMVVTVLAGMGKYPGPTINASNGRGTDANIPAASAKPGGGIAKVGLNGARGTIP